MALSRMAIGVCFVGRAWPSFDHIDRAVVWNLWLPFVWRARRGVPEVANSLCAGRGGADCNRVRSLACDRRGVPQPISAECFESKLVLLQSDTTRSEATELDCDRRASQGSADCDRVDRYRVHAVGHCKATTCEAAAGRLLSRGVNGATCHRGVNDHSLESIGERERLRLGIADRGEAVVPLR
jgi:hypothetical protein